MVTLYGIPNCDTVKKARAWLARQGQAYAFHDFKKLGVPPRELERWTQELGWQSLLNRQGSTWRKLDAATQSQIHDATILCALMLAQPSVIKRPVVDWGDTVTVGFDEQVWHRRIDGAP